MSERILCVDDEPNVLAGYQRMLRKQFDLEVASSSEQGLDAVRSGSFAVVVSDMRMPGMNGSQFLAKVREAAPDSARILLTGFADLPSAISAVNDGHIFRFLTKPCPPETLSKALRAGLEQYRLVKAEKELLEQTVRGIIQVLTDVLSLVNPAAFGRSVRVRRLVRQLAEQLKVKDVWQLEVATMLSQIGCVTVPQAILNKAVHSADLIPEDLHTLEKHPRVGAELVRKIPRLQEVADIIAYQEKHFDGSGLPDDGRKGYDIPQGARILKVALDMDALEVLVPSRPTLLARLRYREGWYDPTILEALEQLPQEEMSFESSTVLVRDMHCGMILGEDVLSLNGLVLLRKGVEISDIFLHRLQGMSANRLIREPIRVLIAVARLRAGSSTPSVSDAS